MARGEIMEARFQSESTTTDLHVLQTQYNKIKDWALVQNVASMSRKETNKTMRNRLICYEL